MIQGTGSSVGKSLLVAGLARAFVRRGLRVRPFKPQNMSNNAAVTDGGGEIGRAQALQARACGTPPHPDMNPVLLKPQSETGAQIIVQGRVAGTAAARDYAQWKPKLLPRVLESFARLSDQCDLVLAEGAGSPAEVNLRAGDIANMGFARAADVPVVLVGDIARGGVIASLIGTWTLLTAAERRHLAGFIINKFRGDPSLFAGGRAIIERRTALPCLGVVPYLDLARLLPDEDSVALDDRRPATGGADAKPIEIAILRYPRIANFDDFDPLSSETDVRVRFVQTGEVVPADSDVVILPGSKSTRSDLAFLKAQGWDIDLRALHRRGVRILGLCGGYQMLGHAVHDPSGIEGSPGESVGLGFLDIETTIGPSKVLREVAAVHLPTGATVKGFEMHMGETRGPDLANPLLRFDGGALDGARSSSGLIEGCYLHGLFSSDAFRGAFLASIREGRAPGARYEQQVEQALDRLADHLAAHLDLDQLLAIARKR
ncbi:MAG: cobyric acid synthase [Alphaproteobacteria bacterium]